MGYTITYQTAVPRKQTRRKHYLWPIMGMCAFFLCVAGWLFFTDALYVLRSWIIPGDDLVTTAAMSVMLDSLQDGVPLLPAFQDFCKNIWTGADIVLH